MRLPSVLEAHRPVEQARRFDIVTTLSVLVGVVLAGVVGALVVAGLWYLAIAVLLAVPGFLLVHRYPLAAVMIWLAITPFLMTIEGGAARRIYWGVHRLIPLATLILIVAGNIVKARSARLPRLGWPEAMMGGYVVVTILSIAYRSLDAGATYIYMYDHVVIPFSLYLIVRLVSPTEQDLQRLVPVMAFLLVTQALIGALSWAVPEALPRSWMNREERTTGTLRHPNVYAIALLFSGLYVAHFGQMLRDRPRVRAITSWLMVVSAAMVVATLSRAAWLALVVVVLGLVLIHPRLGRNLAAVAAAVMLLAGIAGSLSQTTGELLSNRLYSDQSSESALSRLPVMMASVRMLEEKPLFGWGYEDFNRYNFRFVRSIEDLYVPDKDHSSHNLFLTLLAEQGVIGFALYMGPAAWWLFRGRLADRGLGESGFRSRKLVLILSLLVVVQVVVYNFSNLRVAFGLGVWWIVLGLLSSVGDWRPVTAELANEELDEMIAALSEDSVPPNRTYS